MQYNQRFGLRMYNQTSVVQGEAQLSNVVVTSSAQALRGRIGVAMVDGAGSIAAVAVSVIVGVGAADNVVTVLSSATGWRSTEANVTVAVYSDGYAVRRRNGVIAVTGIGTVNVTPFRLAGGLVQISAGVQSDGLGKIIYIAQGGAQGNGTAFSAGVVRAVGPAGVEAIALSLSGSVTKLTGCATPQMVATTDAYAVYIVVDQAVVNALVGGAADSFVFRWIPSQFVQKTWNEFLNGADIWRPVLLPGTQWKQKII